VYVNLEEASEIAEIDAVAMKVTRRWSTAPCEAPVGMAIDVAHGRLFSGCRNQLMAISDASAGKVLATVPSGAGVDGNAFDPATGYAFSSNGDGTLTVVAETAPGVFGVVQTLQTMEGARTLGFDPRTHRLYTVSARFGPMPAQAGGGRRRPPVLPGTFTLLMIGR
jgi:DNA-binding beta-propeller fold protein YncE